MWPRLHRKRRTTQPKPSFSRVSSQNGTKMSAIRKMPAYSIKLQYSHDPSDSLPPNVYLYNNLTYLVIISDNVGPLLALFSHIGHVSCVDIIFSSLNCHY